MADFMPTIPRLFFLYGEPILISIATIQSVTALHSPSTLLPAHMEAAHPPTFLEQFLYLQSTIYLILSGALLTSIMLLAGHNTKLVHVMVALLAVTEPLVWGLMLWVMGRGDIMEGIQACFVRGEWTADMKVMFVGSGVTGTIKVAYLLGLFGKDRIPDGDRKVKGS